MSAAFRPARRTNASKKGTSIDEDAAFHFDSPRRRSPEPVHRLGFKFDGSMKKPLDHHERIDKTLAKVGRKHALRPGEAATGGGKDFAFEAVDWSNPLTELIEAEESAQMEATRAALDALDVDLGAPAVVEKIRTAAFQEFLQFESALVAWFFDAGPHPVEVTKRLFAYTKYRRPDLLQNMAFRALGDLLNERGATMAARCDRLFGDLPAGWKKTREACEHMSESALGNNNRRGGKSVPRKSPSKKTKPKHKK